MSERTFPIVVSRSYKPPGAGVRKLLRGAGLVIISGVLLFGVFGFTSVPDALGTVSYVTGERDRMSCGTPWFPDTPGRPSQVTYQASNDANCARAMTASGNAMHDWFAAGVFLLSASFLRSPLRPGMIRRRRRDVVRAVRLGG